MGIKSVKIQASAPSNIALIKYMGKTDSALNRPTNSSLSLTLEHLRTYIKIESSLADQDQWSALENVDDSSVQLYPLKMSEKSMGRFLKHFQFLKSHFGIEGFYHLQSANNFPSDCGLASSASSFAALTLATANLAAKQKGDVFVEDVKELSLLSQRGSGSSCRSFFGPWAEWTQSSVEPLDLDCGQVFHAAVTVSEEKKEISSSLAHKLVPTSLLFEGRPLRAQQRLKDLKEVLNKSDWDQAFEICWAEFWDMHALFETSRPSFGYMTSQTFCVLEAIRKFRAKNNVKMIATMDAGPNVHLIYRADQHLEMEALFAHIESLNLKVLKMSVSEAPRGGVSCG